MVYSNAPTYYSTLQNSITSLCKTIVPFSFKKRCLLSAEHRLWKLQSDNLKWQQDSFHQMLNLMGLHKEDIITETEVSAFRTHLLDTLLASSSPEQQDHPLILRDKLLFLQELLYSKCISEGEYHSSKRPLLQRLAAQGTEIEARDVILAGSEDMKQNLEEEWSVIDLKDEQCFINKENSNSKKKSKQAMKNIKGATSVFSFVSSYKPGRNSMEKSIFESPSLLMDSNHSKIPPSSFSTENELSHSKENNPFCGDGPDKVKRKPFRTLFHREKREGHGGGGGSGGDHGLEQEERAGKSAKKQQWGFDGFKKWKRSDSDDETAPLSLNERSDSEAFTGAFEEAPDTKLMEKKFHSDGSPSDFSIDDKVLGDKIKKELSRIQTELRSTNPNLKFSNDQMEAISTKLPEDKAELKNYFPKSWCDRHGDGVLDVVKKEFKHHVGEMENMLNDAEEKHENSMGWTTFEDDENLNPNPFVHQDNSLRSSSINPFSYGYAESKWSGSAPLGNQLT